MVSEILVRAQLYRSKQADLYNTSARRSAIFSFVIHCFSFFIIEKRLSFFCVYVIIKQPINKNLTGTVEMSITQKFYDNLASHYDKLFLDWQATTQEQAVLLQRIFQKFNFDQSASILDCACGIGTQSIGLACLGYNVTASDISNGEIAEAKIRAVNANVKIHFENADFCALSKAFAKRFDIVIAMDNALPHMLSTEDLGKAVKSIVNQIEEHGIFVGSIRDYDTLLQNKPPYSPPYIHKTEKGQRVSFQTWDWRGEQYKLTQYIINDEGNLEINKFECEYRATRREELTNLFIAKGCKDVIWMFPKETGFYQPIVIAKK